MINPETFQLPVQMSAAAADVDALYYGIYWFSVAFTVAIYGATLYFIVKYKRRPGVKPEATPDLLKLEIFWTITPVVFIVFLFHIAFTTYIKNVTPAEDAMEIRVRGKKWSWEFEYPNGSREPQQLTIPVNKPVKLVLSSDDVLHSFFIPAVRMKRDAVPGLYSTVAFTPNKKGDAQVFCAEYCGTSHSAMLAMIHIVDDAEYLEHLDKLDKMPEMCDGISCTPQTWGKQLFSKYACTTCHSIDGSRGRGPSLKGVFGTMQPTMQSGEVMADENYVRESILRPQAKIVMGFTDTQMPVFVMKDNQIDALIAYVKSLK